MRKKYFWSLHIVSVSLPISMSWFDLVHSSRAEDLQSTDLVHRIANNEINLQCHFKVKCSNIKVRRLWCCEKKRVSLVEGSIIISVIGGALVPRILLRVTTAIYRINCRHYDCDDIMSKMSTCDLSYVLSWHASVVSECAAVQLWQTDRVNVCERFTVTDRSIIIGYGTNWPCVVIVY